MPKPLPLDLFKLHWDTFTERERQLAWFKAKRNAHYILHKQKLKTGVSIWGTPNEQLNIDEKFQSSLKVFKLLEDNEA